MCAARFSSLLCLVVQLKAAYNSFYPFALCARFSSLLLPCGAAQGNIQFFHPFALMMIQSSA